MSPTDVSLRLAALLDEITEVLTRVRWEVSALIEEIEPEPKPEPAERRTP